jgi:Ca2+-binding RTX toxin-like protein
VAPPVAPPVLVAPPVAPPVLVGPPVAPPVAPVTPPHPIAITPVALPVPLGAPPITIVNVNNNANNTTVVQVTQQQQNVQTILVQAPTPAISVGPPQQIGTPTTLPPLAATDNFLVIDEAAQTAVFTPGAPYTGTVAGVQNQYIDINTTNLDITAITPNAFIQTGTGNDALQALSGRNILDAGGGSNVLVGGPGGQDTFLATVADGTNTGKVPANQPSLIDLIKDFHAGDDAIVRGLSPSDFTLSFTDATGALGPELLVTATANSASAQNATIALAGFSTGDVSSGRLSISFSQEQSGVPFMLIHANS